MAFMGQFLSAAALALLFLANAHAADLDPPNRHELKRADLSGAPGMEVVESVTEYKPGDKIPLHVHHGVEGGYVLQGAMVQAPGKEPMMLETGSPILNLRDVKHGGFTVVGTQSLKLFTVHIVDKGKPLYDEPN
jgi:quercetin dioxygenase-like cupin family protein